jgi:hypothetical protein
MREVDQSNALHYTFNKSRYVLSLLEDWQPLQCRTKEDYRESLYDNLRAHLPDNATVTSGDLAGPLRVDLLIDGEVAVDFSFDLNAKPKLRKLLERIRRYRTWEGSVILVLIGDTDPSLKEDLRSHLKAMNNAMFPRFFIVEK